MHPLDHVARLYASSQEDQRVDQRHPFSRSARIRHHHLVGFSVREVLDKPVRRERDANRPQKTSSNVFENFSKFEQIWAI